MESPTHQRDERCEGDTGSPSYSMRSVVTRTQAKDLDALQKCCHTNTSGTGYGFRMDLCKAALESAKSFDLLEWKREDSGGKNALWIGAWA